jgi:hypothetical protein
VHLASRALGGQEIVYLSGLEVFAYNKSQYSCLKVEQPLDLPSWIASVCLKNPPSKCSSRPSVEINSGAGDERRAGDCDMLTDVSSEKNALGYGYVRNDIKKN